MDAAALFNEHYKPLFRYLSRLVGDPDVAADAAQEAFVKLLEKPPEPTHLRGWLYRTGTNAALEGRRTSARRSRILAGANDRAPIADAPLTPDVILDKAEQQRRVHGALQLLSDRDRTILLMREEGFKHAEIAEAVGTTTGSVGTLIARAMKNLAHELRLDLEEAS